MARKTNEDALVTRNQLLDAAERVFSTQGVTHTSLNEIANSASLTRGAVYWHFANKADLLTALWERAALPIQQAFDETDRLQATDPLARIRRKSCWVAEHIETNEHIRAIMTILLLRCEFVEEIESARLRLLQEREDCLQQMSSEIQLAMGAGQLPASLDAGQTAIGIFALVDGLCFHWLIDPTRFQIATLTRTSVDAYLTGLQSVR